MASIGVIGSGTWGTALAVLLADKGYPVVIWSAIHEEALSLSESRRHPNLPGIAIVETIEITEDLEQAMKDKDLLVMAVPSVFVRQTAAKMKPWCRDGQIVVNVAKGIEEDTLMTLSQVIEDELPMADVAVLSGPSHAEEVAKNIPTACVAASENQALAELVQDAFMSDSFRVYTSADVIGSELGGALKNVIALCAGVSDGMGNGDNTKAMLMTRGLTEIARLGVAMGARKETFAGLAGVGDLIVTCTSQHSRNRRAGILMGQGKGPQEAMAAVGAVVEGYYAAKSAWELACKLGVEMPIIHGAYRALYENVDVKTVLKSLLCRARKAETEDAGWL